MPAGVVKHVATMGQWRAMTLNQWFSSNKEYLIENLYDPHSWAADKLDEEIRDKGSFTMKDENGDGTFNTVASFNLTAGTTYYFHYSYYWDARDLNLLNVQSARTPRARSSSPSSAPTAAPSTPPGPPTSPRSMWGRSAPTRTGCPSGPPRPASTRSGCACRATAPSS